LSPNERVYNPIGFGDDSTNENGEWRLEPFPNGLVCQKVLSISAKERISKQMRDDLLVYLLNEGAVDWQTTKIGL